MPTTKLEAAARQALEALLAATPVKAKDPQLQADAIVALREALAEQQAAEPVEHCEAGPEYCPQCLSESKPTYGSEEVRKLKEVIESQAKIIALMEKERVCPPFWPVVQHLLDEYGLQLIDIVAAYKQATEQPAQEPVAWMWKDGTITSDPDRADGTWTPLYASPPASKPWVGLTEEEIDMIYTGIRAVHHDIDSYVFARAIEAKLKEKNT